jgi:TonB-linked SusC/RagA family outer membrane protein
MKKRALMVLMGSFLLHVPAFAQERQVTGKVTDEQGLPLPSVAVRIRGTQSGTITTIDGTYNIRAAVGQVLQFRLIGHTAEERTVGTGNVIDVQLKRTATNLDAVVVTTLGQTNIRRAIGTAQQTVQGADIASTQRENFINAIQGRVAGVEVTSTSGVPGASTSITIRGVSSISSSNQPLMIIDGLPLDNKTLNTGVLASDAPGSLNAFSNRGVDFTNRAADINPEDIETVVVLKGAEASALYGIDAANGAIVITTKRGAPGGGFDYSNSFRLERTGARPKLQRVYGPTTVTGSTIGSFFYFGAPYADTTVFYDNIDGFFQTAMTQKHNLAFSGGAPDNRVNYRLSVGADMQEGVVPTSKLSKINLTGRSQAVVNSWLKADLSLLYAYVTNDQPYKGANGPLLGLLLWPQSDNAKDWQTPAGTRRRITNLASASDEVDNPYYNVAKNKQNSKNNRYFPNVGLTLTPFSWGDITTNIGADTYTNENLILRHPGSASGFTWNGVIDQGDNITRNINAQTLLNLHSRYIGGGLSVSGMVGNQISDFKSTTNAFKGQDFLDPDFVSVNNTNLRQNRTTIEQRRLVSLFGSATLDYNNYLFINLTGRNDWTSTIPAARNSFFYPSISGSFIFSEMFPSLGNFVTGKVRAAYAEVGKDARPYAYRPSLEFKTTSFGGYGYGFTGPNLALKPEFVRSYEVGTELNFLDDRLGFDITTYRKQTRDQIVNDIRGSYATGFILFNLNGAVTRNTGLEVTMDATPVLLPQGSWDIIANFERARGKVLELPNALPESYVSDTWLFGNVRNGVAPGMSTRSLTGQFYLRNAAGDLLIDPTNGLPIRSTPFIDAGYDRQPDWLMGVNNVFRYKRFSLNFLVDFRKGGDVFNATEQLLTARGLSERTLDREQPRVIEGVLRDGKENSATPTRNTIVVIPAVQTSYYTAISEELFIEKDINWVRLRDVTFRFPIPGSFMQARAASGFVTGTDLFLFTNYSGMDPIVNGNTAAVGGSGAAGIDYGNFPMPRGFSFGINMRF